MTTPHPALAAIDAEIAAATADRDRCAALHERAHFALEITSSTLNALQTAREAIAAALAEAEADAPPRRRVVTRPPAPRGSTDEAILSKLGGSSLTARQIKDLVGVKQSIIDARLLRLVKTGRLIREGILYEAAVKAEPVDAEAAQ